MRLEREKRKVMVSVSTINPKNQSISAPTKNKIVYDCNVKEIWGIIIKALEKESEKDA